MRIHPRQSSGVKTLAVILIGVSFAARNCLSPGQRPSQLALLSRCCWKKTKANCVCGRAVSGASSQSGAQPTAPVPFILKVSPKNNGSERLVLITEDLPPNAGIPKHKHLGQDEIVLIQTGTAHVWLGDEERDLHAGGLVFIPTNTWIILKNTGTEPISLIAIFSAPSATAGKFFRRFWRDVAFLTLFPESPSKPMARLCWQAIIR